MRETMLSGISMYPTLVCAATSSRTDVCNQGEAYGGQAGQHHRCESRVRCHPDVSWCVIDEFGDR